MAREKNIPEEHDPSLGPAVHAVHVGGESILDRLLPHAKKIGLALAGAAVIVAAVFTYRYFQHRKAERATVRVAKALDLVDRPIFNPDPTVPQPPLDQQVFKSETERNEAVMTALGKLGPTRGSVALVEAQTLLRAGKLDAALALYRKRASARGFDGLVAREGVGIVLEAQASAATDPAQKQKLLEEALAAFRAIQPDEQGLRRDYALYHEGRVLEALGKPTEAAAAFQKALAVPDTLLEQTVKTRLSSLGVEPAPPAPPVDLTLPGAPTPPATTGGS